MSSSTNSAVSVISDLFLLTHSPPPLPSPIWITFSCCFHVYWFLLALGGHRESLHLSLLFFFLLKTVDIWGWAVKLLKDKFDLFKKFFLDYLLIFWPHGM